MLKQCLIVFIKNPEKGKVKTRLAATIGDDAALLVYGKLLKYTSSLANNQEITEFFDVKIYCSDYLIDDELWNNFEIKIQYGSDLGIRMHNAIKAETSNGYQKVILIGSDCIELKTKHFTETIKKLENNDVIFGPANDGGYYLVAIKNAEINLFQAIEWSTENVLKQSLDKAKELALKSSLLETLNDLDNYEDYKKFEKKLSTIKI